MRLGLYYDLRNPGGARSWARVYAAALDRIGWADGAGIGAIWVTEHHGFADGYLPAPLTFCAAIAARTRRARIGTAVVVSPLIPPHALAEQAAVVDILSDGRLELGLGAGWREAEFASFGADYARRYEALEHAVRALPRLWESGRVTPAPLQRPLPVWVGARGPRGARLAWPTSSWPTTRTGSWPRSGSTGGATGLATKTRALRVLRALRGGRPPFPSF